MNILDQFRAGQVTRWQIVRTLSRQSVAEHSFNVAMIAANLARRVAGAEPQLSNDVVVWALCHDLAEVYTGDVPTPMRRALEAEHPGIIHAIEDRFAPDIALMRNNVPARIRIIVKAADLMEAAWFLRHEGVGDHAARVLQTIHLRIYDLLASLQSTDVELYDAIADLMTEIDPKTCPRERFVI